MGAVFGLGRFVETLNVINAMFKHIFAGKDDMRDGPIDAAELKAIRFWLVFFMVALALSGITAFPLATELGFLDRFCGIGSSLGRSVPPLGEWISRVHAGVAATGRLYPFMAYGTDWLAFAHLVIAAVFFGPIRDPVRNKWVVDFGLIACVAIFPLALICAPIRSIPWFWTLIDCSFGVIGFFPLWMVKRRIDRLETAAGTARRLAG